MDGLQAGAESAAARVGECNITRACSAIKPSELASRGFMFYVCNARIFDYQLAKPDQQFFQGDQINRFAAARTLGLTNVPLGVLQWMRRDPGLLFRV
jgi:hypothetical protein